MIDGKKLLPSDGEWRKETTTVDEHDDIATEGIGGPMNGRMKRKAWKGNNVTGHGE